MAWEVKMLGEIARITYGYTEKASFDEIGPKFLRITDIQDNGIEWSRVPFCKCSESDLPKYKLETGDIVFARTGATTGKNFLLNNPPNSVFASYLIRLKLISKKDIVPEFVSYYFQTKAYWDQINAGVSGSAQGGFNASKLGELLFSYPKSVTEQKRIVAILDDAFESITKAKENAEKNLNNAKEIFESYLQSVFENKGEGWEEKKLGEICKIKPPKSEARNQLKETDVVSFVPMEDLGINQKILIPRKDRRLKEVEGSYTYFANDDVLLAKITPCFENGKLSIAKNLKNNIGFGSSEYIVFRTNKNIFSEFLYYFLLRSQFREEGAKRMMGAVGHKRVSKEFIENSMIALPSLVEQQSIINKLDTLSDETKKLEAIYTHKLADLEELKKSILAKAFNGELTEASA